MPNPRTSARFDTTTVLLTFGLLGIGIIMLYSSSADTAAELTGDHTYFLKRQLVSVLLGTALFIGPSWCRCCWERHYSSAPAGWTTIA